MGGARFLTFWTDPFADSEADDFGSKSSNYIHIRINQRTARKTLTTVQGLPKELNYDKVLKALKQVLPLNSLRTSPLYFHSIFYHFLIRNV